MNKSKKELLLRAGLEVFYKKGYTDSTIDEIIQHAKCGKGTFYRYFKNKSELVDQLLCNFSKDLNQKLIEVDNKSLETEEALISLLRSYFFEFKRNHKLGVVFHELARNSSELQDAFLNEVLAPNYEIVLRTIEKGINEKIFIKAKAENIFSALMGTLHFFLFRKALFGIEKTENDFNEVINLILTGVRK
jgi:AcrR family transcriptional regulator